MHSGVRRDDVQVFRRDTRTNRIPASSVLVAADIKPLVVRSTNTTGLYVNENGTSFSSAVPQNPKYIGTEICRTLWRLGIYLYFKVSSNVPT